MKRRSFLKRALAALMILPLSPPPLRAFALHTYGGRELEWQEIRLECVDSLRAEGFEVAVVRDVSELRPLRDDLPRSFPLAPDPYPLRFASEELGGTWRWIVTDGPIVNGRFTHAPR